MSAKQRFLVFAAIILTIALAAGLFFFSVAGTSEYDGIFVSGIHTVYG